MPAAQGPGPLARGTAVGRYLLLGRLGAGSMGVVYAAHDPELDRKVALKLLLPEAAGSSGVSSGRNSGRDSSLDGRSRLLREAQALAKLSHPNVVAVHDVGTHGDSVWIAMEFVGGQTLGEWARQRRRRWPEVVQVLADVARGVAAAHVAGLVHRDLKPDNVMIDEDGRVRVMDFGLAHEHLRAGSGSSDDIQAPRDLTTPAMWRTQAGAIQGTPAYMAPEQWKGHAAVSATDQFGWSVMAWELLYGERPFAGDTLPALVEAVVSGQRRSGRGRQRVPGWLRRVVERGLATDPAQRWPTMTAMLAALARGRTRARVRTAAAALAGLALLGAGMEGVRRRDVAARVAVCEAAGGEIEAAWNDDRRQRLREALVATGVSYAETTAQRVMPWLDEQAAAWKQARTDACLNASVRGLWTDDLLGRAQWCLEDRQMELESLVTELGRANATNATKAIVVQKAVLAVARLRPVQTCLDEGLLLRQPAPPTQGRDALRDVRAELSRAHSLGIAGNFNEALTVATQARERAQRVLDWPPLLAAARMREGNLLERTGAYEQAEIASMDAYFVASSSGDWEVAARAAMQLIHIVGLMRARPEEGRVWARHAAMAIANAGDRADLWEAERLNSLAVVSSSTGAHAEARGLNEQALAIFEQALGPDHPSVAMSLNNLAAVHEVTGAYAQARALNERALAIREQALGPDHPDVAMSLNNLANVQTATGDQAQARALHERALAIKEKALGPEHPSVATSLINLAQVLQKTGDLAEARALNERALAIKEKALGPVHPDVAMIVLNLGLAALAEGKPHDALPLLARAVNIVDTSDSVESIELEARFSLARALVATHGDHASAIAEATRARDGYLEAGASKASELAAVEQWLAGPGKPQ